MSYSENVHILSFLTVLEHYMKEMFDDNRLARLKDIGPSQDLECFTHSKLKALYSVQL